MSRLSRISAVALLLLAPSLPAQDLAAEAVPCLDAATARGGGETGALRPLSACTALLARIETERPAGFMGLPDTAAALRDALAFNAEARGGSRSAIATTQVEAILAALEQERQRPQLSTWERFKRWLREWLLPDRSTQGRDPAWLRWLEAIPPEFLRVLWWSTFGIMALTLVWIVVRELREARIFARRKHEAGTARHPVVKDGGGAVPLRLRDISQLPSGAQPAALLRVTLAHLRAVQRLPPDESLTNGELHRRLSGDAEELQLFGCIVSAAEARVYGRREVAAGGLENLVLAAARFEPAR